MEFKNIIKKPRVAILVFLLILGAIILSINGLKYGLDFSGGTQFTIELDKEVTDPSTLSLVTSTISQRLDWSGLKDTTVNTWGGKYVIAQVGTTDPDEIAALESVLYKQGRFENIMDGQLLFNGEDILSVDKNPSQGYSITDTSSGYYSWTLPFTLKTKSAKKFAELTFHKCVPSGTGGVYDCPKTFFFIDRPLNSIFIIPQDLYDEEQLLPADPINKQSSTIELDEAMINAGIEYIISDAIDANVIAKLNDYKSKGIEKVIVPKSVYDLSNLDLNLQFVEIAKNNKEPWVWTASGLKSIIWVNEDITNLEAPNTSSSNFKVFYTLTIRGSAQSKDEAVYKSDNIFVLLSSGSLPVGVYNISKETISPILGQKFLTTIFIIGLLALIVVSLIVYIRYRHPTLIAAIMVSTLAEVFLILVCASIIGWRLDLAAIVGLIAAIGTGVDDVVIITDELSKNKEEKEEHSLIAKVKRAFFMIFAAASITIVAMVPILIFGFGFGKLTGFALTVIMGILIGVIITRPAYSEVVKYIMSK